MTKVDIFSGFLGAGKTTLIKKLIEEAYRGEKLVLIENEFGDIGIDGGFMQSAGIEVTEMNAGCICCSLVGDFGEALQKVLEEYHPDRILIEPSGVGKLSDVILAVQNLPSDEIALNAFVTVADATKCRLYMKNFGEFFNNQIAHAAAIILSRTDSMPEEKLLKSVALLREQNEHAPIITTPWGQLSGKQILETMENQDTLARDLEALQENTCPVCGHDHDHDHHGHSHSHDQHHDHDDHHHGHGHDDDRDHHHHHHDHDHDHDHSHDQHHDHDHGHHHHDHGDDCGCGCGHGHDHHHDADEVFSSWGVETPRTYTEEEIKAILEALSEEYTYGMVLRAKGIVPCNDGTWIHFDYVPGEGSLRRDSASVSGRLCVIGSDIREEALAALFHQN